MNVFGSEKLVLWPFLEYKCGNFRCQNLIRKKDRRRWVGAKIPSSSFTGTSSVQMTNDVQLLTKASSSTTSIVKGSFFLWQELTNDLWVLTLQFDDFLLKPRIDYLPSCVLSRCYWTTSSSSAYNGIIGQQFGSCSDIKNCTEYKKSMSTFTFLSIITQNFKAKIK